MNAGEPAARESRADGIFFPAPAVAGDRDPGLVHAVDGGEGEALGLAIVPAEAAEYANVFGDFLLEVDAGTVFERARLVHGGDVRSLAGLRGDLQSLRVTARVGVQQETEQPDGSG